MIVFSILLNFVQKSIILNLFIYIIIYKNSLGKLISKKTGTHVS